MTLVEKYRGTEWDDIYGNEHIKTVLKRVIKTDNTQHMIFCGRPGCGKTMTARIFATHYLGKPITHKIDHPDYREMNASDERGIDVVRGRKVKSYCQGKSNTPGKKRILFLDEADNLTIDAQRALRAIMENNQDNVIIIMSMNHLERIKEDAILSRCMVFKFDPEPPEMLKSFLLDIASKESISFDDNIADQLVEDIVNFPDYKGDFRRVVNDTLQKLVGIEKPVTMEDIPWIYNESYARIIDNILKDPLTAFSTFMSQYRTRYIDPALFVKQMFKKYRESKEMSFELAKIFAETDMNIKNGGDELVQLSYLLTAIEGDI